MIYRLRYTFDSTNGPLSDFIMRCAILFTITFISINTNNNIFIFHKQNKKEGGKKTSHNLNYRQKELIDILRICTMCLIYIKKNSLCISKLNRICTRSYLLIDFKSYIYTNKQTHTH